MKREVEKKKNGEIKKLKNKNCLSRTFFCNHSVKKAAPFMAPLCIFKKKKRKNKTNSPNYFQIRINRIIQ